jgi:8-oxo-dGTP pyrophosphatase MutT (NUDIX family)
MPRSAKPCAGGRRRRTASRRRDGLAARVVLLARRSAYRLGYRLLRAYSRLRHPSLSGVKCVLCDGELVLLVRHTYGPPGWSLPGGIMRPSEDPLHTARRELAEELGVQVGALRAVGEIQAHIDGRRDRVHCFSAQVHSPVLTLDAAEIAEARWWPRDHLPRPLSPHTLEVLGLARPA